ncbi:cytochrome c3 family protein [bacterium]|nr:cytochrome c3 family protein [bacterium]
MGVSRDYGSGKTARAGTLAAFLLLTVLLALPLTSFAQENDECLMCHGDPDLSAERDGLELSLFVDEDTFGKSVHAPLECIDCHQDLAGAEMPHDEMVADVDCGMCHDDVAEIYGHSVHGQQVAKGEKLAPQCWDCHGKHDILPRTDPNSQVTKFNIPVMCATCHREGTAVTRKYDIPADSVFHYYSQSIHGAGLFQQGLTVTAVCSDCHTAHNVLPHDDPKSSINRANVANTCQNCHGRIEQVHKKVVRGELWEKEPNKVPACVDCHRPHEIRRLYYDEGIADAECMTCHGKTDLFAMRDGEQVSMYVDTGEVQHSIHRSIQCAQCHTGATPQRASRPCVTVIQKVDCSICHSEVVATYTTSTHGKLAERGDPDAPVCETCHGTHTIQNRQNSKSPTFPTNVPDLCSKCHGEGGVATARYADGQRNVVEEYKHGTHGVGLLASGLVVTAMCTDCHTPHHELPPEDPQSTVHHDNIPATCAKCHNGIYEQYSMSIHSPLVNDTDKKLPICSDCHQSHNITESNLSGFRLEIMQQCGDCHEDVTATYFETFHGKVSQLGSSAAAMCYDCHGAHDILPPDEPASHLSRQNVVETCGKCHEGSHLQFAGYLSHATHHDRTKYPILFYTFWFMTTLLVGTLIVAGTHTLLWLPRSFQAMKAAQAIRQATRGQLEYQRFKPLHRRLHIMVVISFLGLAITGMTLKFSYLGWAQWLAELLGGPASAGFIHRVCAVITFAYFAIHIYDLISEKRKAGRSWKSYLIGQDSMLPNKNDWIDLKATIKWFIGMGPRPEYGRWTYWEKFDYFAVFWGVTVIGATGLVLWFPEFFTIFLPGWIINVATIVHSDEALLAVAFIFTVHFFNTHFRPDKFPMDTVIFTGRMPVEELKHDRPREYRELINSRQIRKHLVEPLPPYVVRGLKVFGTVALLIGLALILLIIYAEVFGYK